MNSSDITLTAHDLCFSYSHRNSVILKHEYDIGPLDITLRAGEKTALIGASGCGKSTTLKLLAGLLRPTKGAVVFNNTNLANLREARRASYRRKYFAFVFQDYMLLENLSVSENIALPAILDTHKYIESEVINAMTSVHLDSTLIHKPIFQLSGGQKQRVAISRALMMKASILFADEPTGNLDPKARNETLDAIDSAMDNHLQSCLIVTHDPIVAARADQVLFMQNGLIKQRFGNLSSEDVNDILIGH